MEQAQGEVMPPERIRYGLTRLQRVLPVMPFAVAVVGTNIWEWMAGEPADMASIGMGLALPFVALIPFPNFGVTLTPSAAVVHRWRRRTIPWSDIQAIRIDSSHGVRVVVIHEADGRRTRLRAPITGILNWDRGFEEKSKVIGGWWLEHRGPDWTPVPPRRARRGGPPAHHWAPFTPPA